MNWNSYQTWLGNCLLSKLPLDMPCPNLLQLVTDSREIKPGDWFLPLKGETYDGHDFIDKALENGAAGYFLKDDKNLAPSRKAPFIRVENTMKAYHLIASGWRSSLTNLKLIALTGSVGKTTAKNMLASMLSNIGKTFSTPGNQNTEFSIPKAIFEIDSTYKYAVLEFGARHPGDIATLTEMALPDISICLNAGVAHIEIFKTKEAIINTKLEIVSKSSKNTVGVVFRDNPVLFEKSLTFGRKIISFGEHKDSDICLESYKNSEKGMHICFKIQNVRYELILPFYHETFAINAAAALAAGVALNLDPQECLNGLKTFSGVKGRYQISEIDGGKILIDDSYNANPDSMKAGLTSLVHSFNSKKALLILGDMRELGDMSEKAHREIAPYCVKISPLRMITVGTNSKFIADECIKSGLNPKTFIHFNDVSDLLKDLHFYIKDVDLIYIKSSFSIQLTQVVDKLTHKENQGI